MLRNMDFVTRLEGGDRFATLDVEAQVNEVAAILEERYDDCFKPRQHAYQLIKALVHHITNQCNDSLFAICNRYSKTTFEYTTLLSAVVRYDHEFRQSLNELAGSDNIVGQVRFSEETEFMVVQIFTLDNRYGQTRFDKYIDGLKADGQPISREIERLLEEWRSIDPDVHIRHQGIDGRTAF